jgi:cell division septum initiation protein DivIVA
MKLERSLDQWAGGKASVIAEGSKAQVMYFIEDAQKDIAALAAEISRLTAENAELLYKLQDLEASVSDRIDDAVRNYRERNDV